MEIYTRKANTDPINTKLSIASSMEEMKSILFWISLTCNIELISFEEGLQFLFTLQETK